MADAEQAIEAVVALLAELGLIRLEASNTQAATLLVERGERCLKFAGSALDEDGACIVRALLESLLGRANDQQELGRDPHDARSNERQALYAQTIDKPDN